MYPFNPTKQKVQTDVKSIVADQGFIANLAWTAAETVASDTDGIFDGIATSTSKKTTATPSDQTFVAQPPCARNITVKVAASTAGNIAEGTVKVTGTNIANEEITETFTFAADTAATKTGSKAFKTVTSVEIPVQDGTGVTFDVGFGELLGLPYKLSLARLLCAFNDGVADSDVTSAVSASAIESNTIDFGGSLDGSVLELSLII